MYKRILVSDDGSATARKALNSAIVLAKESGGQIRLLHLMEELPYVGYEAYGNFAAELLDNLRVAGNAILADGIALVQAAGVAAEGVLIDHMGETLGTAVAAAATDWQSDLIVVGTHGRRGVSRLFLGSGADKVIRQASVPVLVIRGDVSTAAVTT